MSSQAFFWMNISCGLILIILFLVGRRSGLTAPSKLNLRRGQQMSGRNLKDRELYFRSPLSEVENLSGSPLIKNLNVVFMYNGHTFDAFEVLGAPAGASYETAEKFFNQALARQSSDRGFLEAALSAIRQERKEAI